MPTVPAVKFILLPEHKVVLADANGATGVGLTVTDTVPFGPAQPDTVAFTEYTPLANVVVPAILGFWLVDVKPFGPVQLYVAPAIVDAVKLKVWPAHNGPFEATVGAAGIGLTVKDTVPFGPAQPDTVAFTEYTPPANVVVPTILGF